MTEIQGGVGDLIARLRRDGVEAAAAEKARLTEQAQAEAQALVDEARKEAAKLLKAADAEAHARREKLDAELRLAARDFVSGLRQRLTEEIIGPAIAERAGQALGDEAFLKEAIRELLVRQLEAGDAAVEVTVAPELRTGLEAFFANVVAEHVDSGRVVFHDQAGLKGFRLTRSGASFAWDASEEAVARAIARLVDPRLRELLLPKV
jgi:V/A-type H+-transporting ATPase subunit E